MESAQERRVWRIARLLTGDDAVAAQAVQKVMARHPDLNRVGESRIDREAVLVARAHKPSPAPTDMPDPAADLWTILRALDERSREAWLFLNVLMVDPIAASNALGIARTPLENFAGSADKRINAEVGERREESIRELRRWSEGGGFEAARAGGVMERARADRKRRIITGLQVGALLVGFALLIYVLIDLLRWNDRQAETDAEMRQFSNIPEAAPDEPDRPEP